MCHLIGFDLMLVVAGVEWLYHWVLFGFAALLKGYYDFVVEMGWKCC